MNAPALRIFVFVLGTRGDVALFLALARELRRRGHTVGFGCPPWWAERARAEGLEVTPLGVGTQDDLVAELRALAAVSDKRERTRRLAARWLAPQLAAAGPALREHVAAAGYVVNNLKLFPRRGGAAVPCASITYDPPDALDDLVRFRAHAPPDAAIHLVALCRDLVDPDGRWDAAHRFTGFWRASDPALAAPPADLAAFVEGGSPPVVVTLGSMATFEPAPFLRTLADALGRTGQRGVVVGGYSDVCGFPSQSPTLRCVKEAPYDWLFARASCVAHHGGCGTVEAVLRAGKPSILLPQVRAQEVFAEILVRAGVAAGVIETQGLGADALAAAIARGAGDTALHARARSVGRAATAEDGLAAATDAIERHAAALAGAQDGADGANLARGEGRA